ncbi:MAG: histidine kinase [Bacteroidota bacterium]
MTRQAFIFTRQFPQRLYRHIVFWVGYYMFSLLTYFHPLLEKTTFGKWFVLEMVEVSWHVLTQMFFCYVILYLLLPRYFQRRRWLTFAVAVGGLAIVTYTISYFGQVVFFSRIHRYAGLQFLTPSLLRWYTFIAFISYCPISTGLAIAIKTLKNFYNKQTENEQLTRENANAELQLLKAQVHPHFLFNTLNNIYSFTLDNDLQAPGLVTNLSDTLQYMITDCDAPVVPLFKEIKMIQDYTGLEKVRYGNRLELNIHITGDLEGKLIVPLLMIPFVENSFKHGASAMRGPVWITLFIQADENMLHFTLTNSRPFEASHFAKGGIGLNNVRQRLELLYPGRYLLKTELSPNTFTVNMQVPLELLTA